MRGLVNNLSGRMPPYIRHTAAYALARLVPAVAAAALLPLLTHVYGPTQYGNYSLGLGMTTFLVGLVATGTGFAVLRLYPAARAADSSGSFVRSAGILTLVTIVAVLALSALALLVGWSRIRADVRPFLLAGLVLFIPLSVLTIAGEVLRAQLRPGAFIVVQWFYGLGSVALIAVLVILIHPGILTALTAATIVASIACLIAGRSATAKERITQPTLPAHLRGLWSFAWPLSIGGLGSWALRLSDRYVLEAFHGPRIVGVYSSAYDLSERVMNLLMAPILLAIQPLAIYQSDASRESHGSTVLGDSLRFYLFLTGGLLVATMFGSPLLVETSLGHEFREAASLIGLLSAANLLMGIVQIGILMLAVQTRPRMIAGIQIVTAAAKSLVNLAVIPRGGALAAAISTLVFALLILCALLWIVGRGFRHILLNGSSLQILIGFLLAVGSGMALNGKPFHLGTLARLVSSMAVYIVVTAITLWFRRSHDLARRSQMSVPRLRKE